MTTRRLSRSSASWKACSTSCSRVGAAVAHRRFLPAITVMHAMATAHQGGTAGRPDPQVEDVPGLYVVGDWVGAEGLLVDASLASARRAAELIAARTFEMRAAV